MRDPDAKRRLVSEARAASALDHASVCPTYDVEETPDGRIFLAMAKRADTTRRGARLAPLMLATEPRIHTGIAPLLQTFGTPMADKRHMLYSGGHDIAISFRSQVVQEVVGWLDRYLGRIQERERMLRHHGRIKRQGPRARSRTEHRLAVFARQN